jgi:hypothetical protein
MDVAPTLGQGVDLKKKKEKALEKEGTKILKKAGIKKNGTPKK